MLVSCDSRAGERRIQWSSRLDSYFPDSVLSLKDLTLGWAIATIGDRAFQLCSALQSVTIPDSVTSIGVSAFFILQCIAVRDYR